MRGDLPVDQGVGRRERGVRIDEGKKRKMQWESEE